MSGTDYMKRIPIPSTVQLSNQSGSDLSDVTEESLEWFHDSPEFKSWISTDDSTCLWLHGRPGDGKTVVATYLRQSLSNPIDPSQKRDIASIFCSRGETEIGMVWSLATQLSFRIDQADAEPSKVALPGFSRDHSEEADLRLNIWKVLEALILLLPEHEVIFIIDGFDEIKARTRIRFLRSLHDLEKNIRGTAIIRILISCRDYPDIRDALGHCSTIERGKEWNGKSH